jgi:murein DD-endopeptidase MepM/ murein hydrolase activator NlpD
VGIRDLLAGAPKRHVTVQIIPDSGSTNRSYVVSLRSVYMAAGGAGFALLLLLFGLFSIFDAHYAHSTKARLRVRVDRLEREAGQIASLREQLAELWVIHARLQGMLDPSAAVQDGRPMSRSLPWGVPLASWTQEMPELKPTEQPEQGVQFYSSPGTLVLASDPGLVLGITWHPVHGDVLVIDHGEGVRTAYAHDWTMFAQPGERVARGQAIGVMHQTDGSRDPSLFYQVVVDDRSVNPLVSLPAFSSMPIGRLAASAVLK